MEDENTENITEPRKRGRPRKYNTIEEKRKAQAEKVLKYYHSHKQLIGCGSGRKAGDDYVRSTGRVPKYKTIEEKYEAHREACRRYNQRKRQRILTAF